MKNRTHPTALRAMAGLLALVMVLCLVPVTEAKAATATTIYFQNNWMWTDVRVHYWGSATTTWPGEAMTLVENDGSYDIYSAVLPAGTTGIVISGIKNDGTGTRDQTPDITDFADGDAYRMLWDGKNTAEKFLYTPAGENPDVDISLDVNQITLRIHYTRSDGDYTGWNVAAWNDQLNRQYDFALEDGEMIATALLPGRSTQNFSFKVRKTVGNIKWAQEEAQVSLNLATMLSGTVDVYVTAGQGQTDLTYGEDIVRGNKISDIQYDYTTNALTIATNQVVSDSATAFSLVNTATGGEVALTLASESGNRYTLTPETAISLNDLHDYKVLFLEDGNPQYGGSFHHDISYDTAYYTQDFIDTYTYTGSDLGATYTPGSTSFRLWAPTAKGVSVKLYATGSDSEAGAVSLGDYPMTADQKGTWVVTIDGDLKNIYYTYAVDVAGQTVEVIDPYARAAGVNGQRGMILDLDSTDPEGWAADTNPNPITSYTDAVIYELHVRDFSIHESSGVSAGNRGKYLAFTELGTTVNGQGAISTGVDYLSSLGITHLHLLPFYDYGSVDESDLGTPQFNWGYDPVNYNIPEGSYSTNPYDGNVRISEVKQMVQSLHNNGISVVMDVVYNHVYDAEAFSFNRIVPDYFSRVNSNTSGCGNDTASERAMVRKYIVESVLYWAEEYHIDGFRFDLVGLLDVQTINQIVTEVHAVRPDILFYGEGWDMDSTNQYPADLPMAKQGNASLTPGFAYFSDSMRNLLAGNNGYSTGFVSGAGNGYSLASNYLANPGWTTNPQQVIQYASCHDNHTLVDKLIKSTGKSALDSSVIAMNNLTAAIYLTSQGVPFIHAGEELLREKLNESGGRVENSYNSSDYVNQIHWENLEKDSYAQTSAYYQGLIAFRKAHAALRLDNAQDVHNYAVNQLSSATLATFWINGKEVPGETHDGIYLIFNAGSNAASVTLPEGDWDVCVNGQTAGTEVLSTVSGTVSVPGVSALVLVQENSELTPDAPDPVSNVALPGSFNGWNQASFMGFQEGSTTVTSMTLDLPAGTYQFKIKEGATWYGNGGTIADSTAGAVNGWLMDASAGDCTLQATGGRYTFLFDTATKHLKVIYDPEGGDLGGEEEYFLYGYINGANYGEGLQASGYQFDAEGKLTVTFDVDSYVGVKNGTASQVYATEGWLGSVTAATLYDVNRHTLAKEDKLMVPGGTEITFTLTVSDDGTALLSYTAAIEDVSDTSGIQQAVTLHCWNWSFDEIRANLPLIASQGYTAIQTSPVQPLKEATNLETNSVGTHWWVYYQPVGFTITSDSGNALGTGEDLQALIHAAHEYDIQVIVDVVVNHLGNNEGNDLSPLIPEKYQADEFWHSITTNTTDYSSRYDVTQHCMGGLPDLNTGNPVLQADILAFLQSLVDMGVDGFRFDAAKHVETPEDEESFASDFWPTIVNGVEAYAQSQYGKDLYLYGELLDSINGVSANAYTQYMSVTDNTWGNNLRKNLVSGNAALQAGYDRAANADTLVIWAESHDTYATENENESSFAVTQADILKTWALVAARKDTMALYLARPADMAQALGVASLTGWEDANVAVINRFHNDFLGQAEYVANEQGISYVERGTHGAVLVQAGEEGGQIAVTAHLMADGSYIDQISGNPFTVQDGVLSGTMGTTGIAVVTVEAEPQPDPDKNGLYKAEDGSYYYYLSGVWQSDYTGLIANNFGNWYIVNGMAQLSYDGLVELGGTKYLIKSGRVNESFTGITKQQGVYYYFTQGIHDLQFEGLVLCNGMKAYVQDGEVNFNKSGIVEDGGTLLYVKYGIWRNTFKGLARADDGNWLYFVNGTFDESYTGVAKLNSLWVYVAQGYVDFKYTGAVVVGDVTYQVKYGVVQF